MRIRSFMIVVPLLAGGVGCGGTHDAGEKQLEALRAEVAKVRADQAVLAERLDNLDLARGTLRAHAAADAASDRPTLDIVRVAPEVDPDADGVRPVLRSTGSGTVVEGEASRNGAKGKPPADASKRRPSNTPPAARRSPGPDGVSPNKPAAPAE